MFEVSEKDANDLLGFKESGNAGYPCYYCGVITTLLDAESFHICAEHQREYSTIGYDAMQKKYPLAGKDERNPEFFDARAVRHLELAKCLTKDELSLIVKRGYKYEQEYAQAILDGKTLQESEMRWLGRSVEKFIATR